MTDADHFAINAWMLSHGFEWVERVHPDGGQWTYIHPDVGMIQLTQNAAAFAFFQYLKGGRQGSLGMSDLVPQPLSLRQVLYALMRMKKPRA